MSDYLKATNTYDFTKNIKDLEINPGFILGLDAIIMFYIGNIIKDPATLPATFKKFEKIISDDVSEENPIELDYLERHMYTLFALQQLLRAKAKEQNLEIPLKSEVTKEHLTEYMRSIIDDDGTAEERLKKIESLIKPKSS